MKKTAAVFLALLLAIPILPAAAFTSEPDPCVICHHNYAPEHWVPADTIYEYFSSAGHHAVTIETFVGPICGVSYQRPTTSPILYGHQGPKLSASCNGTIQTVTNYCNDCHVTFYTTVTCPRAPHTGSCHWLVA